MLTQFNSLNPFLLKGIAPDSIFLIYDSLMKQSVDHFHLEAHVASCVRMNPEHTILEFTINPQAKWHDRQPITNEDVAFTLKTLQQDGHPFYANLYGNIKKTKLLEGNRIQFISNQPLSTEEVFSIGRLTILPKQFWTEHDFANSAEIIPLGSAAYRLAEVTPKRMLRYEFVPHHWAKDQPYSQGRYNFEQITYHFFSDTSILRQATYANDVDLFQEALSKAWATQYNPKLNQDFTTNTLCVADKSPQRLQALQLNLRNPLLQDELLRRTIAQAFDFNWSNQHLFYNQYQRANSFFAHTPFSGQLPLSDEDLAILSELGPIPESIQNPFKPATFQNRTMLRAELKTNLSKLLARGYTLKNGQLYSPEGQAIILEILTQSDAFERIFLAHMKNLESIGITLKIRKVIPSQYIRKIRDFDYDLFVNVFQNDGWPISEVKLTWDGQYANIANSLNYSGLNDKYVNDLIAKISSSVDQKTYEACLKALDRYLLNQHIVITQWYIPYERILAQKNINFPKGTSPFGLDIHSLWSDKATSLAFKNNCPTI